MAISVAVYDTLTDVGSFKTSKTKGDFLVALEARSNEDLAAIRQDVWTKILAALVRPEQVRHYQYRSMQ